MILGTDGVKIDLTARHYELFLENRAFLGNYAHERMLKFEGEVARTDIASSLKTTILTDTQAEMDARLHDLHVKNAILDTEISNLLGTFMDTAKKMASVTE